MLMPRVPIGSSRPQVMTSGSLVLQPNVSAVSHRPVKSGLPSAVFGTGAARLGLPSAVLGRFAVGYFNHCAEAAAGQPRAALIATANRVDRTGALRMCPILVQTRCRAQPSAADQEVRGERGLAGSRFDARRPVCA